MEASPVFRRELVGALTALEVATVQEPPTGLRICPSQIAKVKVLHSWSRPLGQALLAIVESRHHGIAAPR